MLQTIEPSAERVFQRSKRPYQCFTAGVFFIGFFVVGSGCGWALDPAIDSPMYKDPLVPHAKVAYVFGKGLIPLWREALEQSGADVPCQAALTIIRAHKQGMPGLVALDTPLIRLLADPNRHPTVHLACARALVELNARASAPALWKTMENGDPELAAVIEPALARWDYLPARKLWLKRLNESSANGQAVIRAIQCLGTVRAAEAVEPLRAQVLALDTKPGVRLEAARALGAIRTSGEEDDARRLLKSASHDPVRRISAATLLSRHRGKDAIHILQDSLNDTEPAVARIALTRLTTIDPRLVLPSLTTLLGNRDSEVRLGAIQVLVHEVTRARLSLLADRCDDAHPAVRMRARTELLALAGRPEFRSPIITLASRLLHGKDWRGQEQAAILLAQLGHRPAATRLVALLNSNQPDVCLAAAWGVRRLADPETLPAAYAYVRALHEDLIGTEFHPAPRQAMAGVFDDQMSQLIQFIGKSQYHRADSLLRAFVPKETKSPRPPVGPEARAAAIWALGLFHENKPEPALTAIISKPLIDVLQHMTFDDPRVYHMAIIALARMKSAGALRLVSQFYRAHKPSLDPANNAAGWAIEHLTGKPVPHEATIVRVRGGWFLRPAMP